MLEAENEYIVYGQFDGGKKIMSERAAYFSFCLYFSARFRNFGSDRHCLDAVAEHHEQSHYSEFSFAFIEQGRATISFDWKK